MKPAMIYYIRPGKGEMALTEDIIAEDISGITTFITLQPETSARLTHSLIEQKLIQPDQSVLTITKVYFFDEPFNILEFRAPDGSLLGHYSDIGQPLIKRAEGAYEMTDLFLDIWLFPDRSLLELDWDEFEAAVANQVITPSQADLARAAMQRLKGEVALGIYPGRYFEGRITSL